MAHLAITGNGQACNSKCRILCDGSILLYLASMGLIKDEEIIQDLSMI